MSVIELLVLALGLSMDAFAVSICKGLSVPKLQAKHCLICGVYFGGFQALMPLIGWALGIRFQSMITNIDHWIAFDSAGRHRRQHDQGILQQRGGMSRCLLRV